MGLIIANYSAKDHKEAFERLLELRDLPKWHTRYVPALGILAMQNKDIIAAGFLRQMENNYAVIDEWITDPRASSELRSEGISKGLSAIIDAAKTIGIKKVFAHTPHSTVVDRLVDSFGFTRVVQHSCELWIGD